MTIQTFSVRIIDDKMRENNESFELNIIGVDSPYANIASFSKSTVDSPNANIASISKSTKITIIDNDSKFYLLCLCMEPSMHIYICILKSYTNT